MSSDGAIRKLVPVALALAAAAGVTLTMTACSSGTAATSPGIPSKSSTDQTRTTTPESGTSKLDKALTATTCAPGELSLGESKTYEFNSTTTWVLTAGNCFDRLDSQAEIDSAAEWPATQTTYAEFCTKLDVQPEINAFVGHGFFTASFIAGLPAGQAVAQRQGKCVYQSRYLDFDAHTATESRGIVVAYVSNTQSAGDDVYVNELNQLAGITGAVPTPVAPAIGSKSVFIKGGTRAGGDLLVATDGQDHTVVIKATDEQLDALLPDVAKKALALASTLN